MDARGLCNFMYDVVSHINIELCSMLSRDHVMLYLHCIAFQLFLYFLTKSYAE